VGFSHWKIEPKAVVNSLDIGKNSLSSEKQLSFLKYWLFPTCYAEIKHRNSVSLTGQGFKPKNLLLYKNPCPVRLLDWFGIVSAEEPKFLLLGKKTYHFFKNIRVLA
jgi:hypothetical protein